VVAVSFFELSRSEYFRIMEMKTGELFALSCDLAALLAGATAEQREAMRRFGMAFGTAYQIFDDCLDLFGTEAQAGKSLGTDLVKGKMTLPLIVLRETASAEERSKLAGLLKDWQPGSFPKVAAMLHQHQCWQPAQETIHQYLNTARRCLEAVPPTEGLTALGQLAGYLEAQVAALEASRAR
jgi:octaprenyl-diphosphate synthase